MKEILHVKWTDFLVGTLFTTILFLSGCSNLTPVAPQPTTPSQPQSQSQLQTTPQPNIPATPLTSAMDFTVTYNYNDTDKVQLSSNNLVLKVGQKLTLQPAPGLTTNTRFISSGDYFFGNVMKQETDNTSSSTIIFTAINPGKGILQIIPNTNQTDRAVDLAVTVQ